MRGNQVRSTFLEYFAGREHRVVPSAPLVPVGDATLLFTNAGMNQFKDVFRGHERRDYVRATSAQKCLRVSGKHNDLEQVGRTARHHTFFEMLGNFSFGDYFKETAVEYAWDLLIRVYGLDPGRLTATVFAGEDGLPADEEAADLWQKIAGLPAERILRLGARENFWRMGETGPCGPCSELHFDQGSDAGCGRSDCQGPACECDRFLEIWNLVFMQFDQQADGRLEMLPAPSIDTGMGLERLAAVLQEKKSNYDTDLFTPIIGRIAASADVDPQAGGESRVSLQVVADHLRAIAFLVADGIVPANEGRGYVLRRVLRRAYRHGRRLGEKGPFLHRLLDVVATEMGAAYPELLETLQISQEVCLAEEERFEETLDDSLELLERSFKEHSADRRIPGDDLFRLYDTFGLPLDLAEDLARERGYDLDLDGFHQAMEAQRKRARLSWKGGPEKVSQAVFRGMAQRGVTSSFLGYQREHSEGTVLALVRAGVEVSELKKGETGQVVLDRTPLYAESGGQVGEKGNMIWEGGRADVSTSTAPVRDLIAHAILLRDGTLRRGSRLQVRCDAQERRATRRNHTATHLLHAVLKQVLGPHVKQAGSLVAPDRLRFDFTHYRALTPARLREIEDRVNDRILANAEVVTRVQDLEEAIASGAVALFGEKYGDTVRVVEVPGFSSELCGGLHCSATGDIGLFKITGERGISAGVRRLEALTGEAALQRFRMDQEALGQAADRLGVPRDEVAAAIGRLVQRQKDLQKELGRLRLKMAGAGADALELQEVGELKVLTRRIEDLDRNQMRQLADALKEKADIVILGTRRQDRVALLVAVRDSAAERVPASQVVDRLARLCGGRGGGKPTLAEAGGQDSGDLDGLLRQGGRVVHEILMGGNPS